MKCIQVEPAAAADGVAARVVGQSFHGPETVLRLTLADRAGSWPQAAITALTLAALAWAAAGAVIKTRRPRARRAAARPSG